MDDSIVPADAVVLAHIEIVRYMRAAEDADHSDVTVLTAEDGNGDRLSLVESLGLLRLAEDTAFAIHRGDFSAEDDDDE